MEVLFRKYFWAVHLVFLFAVMFIVARTANIFVEQAVSPLASGQGPRSAAVRPKPAEPPAQLSIERLSKLTGLPLPVKEPDVVEPAEPTVDLNSPPVRSGLRVKLLGTLLASIPEWSIASIQDVVTQKSRTYMLGDILEGTNAEILEIDRAQVIVLNGGRREFIDATPGDGSAVAAYVPPPAPVAQVVAGPVNTAPPPSGGLGAGIRALTENEYEVPRAEIDRTLSNLNDVAMQARIVPAFKDGTAQGFKLFSIRPDSIYTKIGIQNGDVIRRINGYDLNSPEKALEIYSKLKEASRIDIEIERNGSVVRKTYSVR
ncbi:MAG: general secretion pathway protein GspC [Myxococcales bacterium]|nr:general secretion pathway protein GspC [Myxococcales bacterium]